MALTLDDLPRHVLTGERTKARRKYRNEPVVLDGLRFDSRAEARRWADLELMQRAGRIRDLQRQVLYELIPSQPRPSGGTERPCEYVADFVYTDCDTGRLVCEDVKGAATPEYRIKRKLMLWRHGIEVREVPA